jgi:hypothetical protein
MSMGIFYHEKRKPVFLISRNFTACRSPRDGRDGLGQAAGGVKGGGFEFNPVFAWDWRGYGWNFTTRAAAIA